MYVHVCLQHWAPHHWPSLKAQDRKALQAAADALATSGSAAQSPEPARDSTSTRTSIHWFPEWGCALLALSCHSPEGAHLGAHLDHATLHLVAADEWRYDVHM
jgi:hypothetical protein